MTDEVERQSELLRHMRILRRADVPDVIAAFGGLRPMANKMGVAVSTVQGWKDRKKFPDNRLGPIIQKMKEVGIQIEALDPTPEMDPTYKNKTTKPSAESSQTDSVSPTTMIDDVMSTSAKTTSDTKGDDAKPFGGILEDDAEPSITMNRDDAKNNTQTPPLNDNPYEQVQAQAFAHAQGQNNDSFFKRLKSWTFTTVFGMALGIGGFLWMQGYFDGVGKNPTTATAKITAQNPNANQQAKATPQSNRRVVFVDENNKPVQLSPNAPQKNSKAMDMFSRQSYEKDISEMFMQNRELLGRVQMLQDRLDAMLAQPVVDVATVGDLRDDLIRAQQNEVVLKNKINALESRIYDFETRLLDRTSEQELLVQQKLTEMLKRISENAKGEKNGAGRSAQALWLNQALLVVGNVQAGSQTGRPFTPQAEQLAYMFKGENALSDTIADINAVARVGVYSIGHIGQAMMQRLPQLQQAYVRPEAVETWFDFAQSMVARVFTVRRVAADAPGTSPVTQIEIALAKQDLQTVANIIESNPKIKRGMGDLSHALADRLLYDDAMTAIHAYLKRRMQETYDAMVLEKTIPSGDNN